MCLSLTPPNPMADSDSAYSAIKKDARILVVGAGRIGCEVLKTLVLSGCQDIYIIDKDFIEVDDLDGQFLFRPSHVGKTKAGVARRAVLNFRPDITINSCHGNVKDPEFDVNFFKQFNVVVNGVDNFDVWRHVNRLCLAADVPLIGSWTTGFLGQVTVHVKEVTECYECQPKPAFGIPLLSLFEAKYIVGNIIPNVATTIAIIAGLIVTETVKVLQNDKKNYRMTYCFENPKNKMLLVPVVPFKPSKSCYVCSEAPLSLEINTKCAKLRDIVEKVIKNKLGMNYPLILHGDGGCLYEDFKELDAAMVIKYEANLDKVLAEFSNPVTNGTMLEIEDFEQGVSCKINIIHREAFDEEKEPDKMVLSGSTHATTVVKDTSELEADKNNEIETSPPRKKRKWAKVSGANPDDNSVAAAAPCSMSNKGACQICIKDLHHTVNCPWLKCVPPGSTVGPDYLVICRVCGFELHQPTMNWCFQCCEDEGGRGVEASTVDEYRRNTLKGYRVVGSKEEGDIWTELSYMRARLA